jgi:uncharacterized protein (TIGR00369 family)
MSEPLSQDQIRERIATSPYHRWTGTELVSYDPGVVRIAAEVQPHHHNPQGIVHGGVLAGLLDTACGLALRSLLPSDRTHRTVQLSINYLKAVRTGRLVATGRAVHKGRSMGVADAEVRDEQDRVLARATATFMTLPAAPRPPE